MRIIAGSLKGRKLTPPTGDAIRPTSDRTRESIFNLLMHGRYAGESIIGQHVVDLCCGTGALGLEAISRGARTVTFIDKDKKSMDLTRSNVLHCGVVQQAFYVQGDATRLPPAREPAALVLMDPPYASPMVAPAYRSLRAQGWLVPGSMLVAEQPLGVDAPALVGAELIDSRKYGKTMVHMYVCV
jgi:16S rRNA (guanine966-N2)-methyltransferase